jgi:8-hydroxy-5-deazaflavin:NADPH oxidoreductase
MLWMTVTFRFSRRHALFYRWSKTHSITESRWVEKQLGRPVIKAFNNMYAQHQMNMGRPAGAPDRIALPVAGDDDRAKAVVIQLIDELGFDPIDSGGLDESWRQQPGTPVYTADLDAGGVRNALAKADRKRGPEFQAESASRDDRAA